MDLKARAYKTPATRHRGACNVPGFQVAGDLMLSADGRELVLVRGAQMALQQIRVGAEIWQGQLSWDPDAGLPMLQQILVKGPDFRVIQQVFRSFILDTAGVVSLDDAETLAARSRANP